MTAKLSPSDENGVEDDAPVTPKPNLASNLVGKTINGWFVEKKISKDGARAERFRQDMSFATNKAAARS